MIPVARIYDEVCRNCGRKVDDDSFKRLLNKRLTKLLEKVAFVSKSELKDEKGKKLYLPNADAPIVRNLLVECEKEEEGIISKWLNGSYDTSIPINSIILNGMIEEPIRRAEIMQETDSVTVDEWIATIRCLTGFEYAKQAQLLMNKMNTLRVNSMGTRTCVNFGAIYVTDESGSRDYISEPQKKSEVVSSEILDLVVSNLNTANDYYVAINQITDKMLEKMESETIETLKFFANAKILCEQDKVFDIYNYNSIVSDYVPYYNRLADYCKNNPKIVKEIEKEMGIENLEDFLRCNSK